MPLKEHSAALLMAFGAAPPWARFDQKTVAAVRGCSEATLERDRWAGTGIPFVRDGRSIRYIKQDILGFLDKQQRFDSTAQADLNGPQPHNRPRREGGGL